jgi:hypothetical protein
VLLLQCLYYRLKAALSKPWCNKAPTQANVSN